MIARLRPAIMGALCMVLGVAVATGAPNQDSCVTSGAGGWSSNTTQRTVSCVGQPGEAGVSANRRYTHYAGFIGGAFIQPGTTNSRGVALEADPDNDDDGLSDSDEVTGSAFQGYASTNPNAADTDGDGMSDADEAAGMYDPNDANHLLAITAMDRSGENVTLQWIGKGGGTVNTILWTDDLLTGPPTNVLHSAVFAGGVAPWFKATNAHAWVDDVETGGFYRVTTQ